MDDARSHSPDGHAPQDAATASGLGPLGYPRRSIVALAAALAIALALGVLPVGRGTAGSISALAFAIGAALIVWYSLRDRRVRTQSAAVLTALGATTSDLPVSLRTRMPLVMVVGDGLANLFNRAETEERLAHVGDGAIWLRVDRSQDLPPLAAAVREWRDGRAPDGVVLALAPACYRDEDALAQGLRLIRQASSDASRLLGERLPGYLAVFQRLTPATPADAPAWYGVSADKPLHDASCLETVLRAVETEARGTANPADAWRAASLAALAGWTQRVVVAALHDRRQPAAPWPLHGLAWIDCGPAASALTPWGAAVTERTRLATPLFAATPAPWPLPQPLIDALPGRAWISPRIKALSHALAIVGIAAAMAFWGAARNNETLLAQAGANLQRFASIPADHDAARRDALRALTAQRDQLDRYQRTGVPLRLGFGMYRGAALLPALNEAIASYQPPPPPPAIVTLDSMSLFDTGKARLKPGSTRAMVGALEMIKTNPDKRILIAGHTDNVGGAASNQRLSVARAAAVRDWLMEASAMPESRFAIQGYGAARPIADNAGAEGRARNRRVEITLIPDSPGA
ncbi:OmpA family protein [Trinickia terrae]|uniref:OmpA family protein n=1 Tax=Trinickia terrae TaxID=2571161 RepID=A0A4U1I4C0_9BURK|nr:OmpA family protein [Trinickia terrae]TKC88047.1 OmpA family protein [Trinickia terrae]